ncbi:MAG: LTA synthase family protein [Spirochaetaceae bacterium]|nr:MAG: LTA synthase family protein [Spirochaetaceae bacterium]
MIVIQVESLDGKLIDYRYNGVEVTPFVNSLVADSLYGTSFYAQHVNGSFDADFSLLTGLYPVNRHFTFRDHDMTRFPSLVRILRERGYQTLAFHGNDGDFFNRNTAFTELGFDRFYSLPDFDLEERFYELDHAHLGINDYDFLRQSLDYLDDAREPFFAFFITVTSHTPFTFYPEEFRVPEFEEIPSALVRDFFNSLRFTDAALEMFFRGLEARGLTENTLIIIYADHEAAIQTPVYASSIGFQIDRNIKEPEHIPLLIRHPDLEPGILEKTGTITDLAPTIMDMLGIDEAPHELMGASLLNPEEDPVLFIHELPQVLYRDQLFVAEIGTLTPIGHVEGKDAAITIPPEEEQLVLEKIRYSREIMLERRRVE